MTSLAVSRGLCCGGLSLGLLSVIFSLPQLGIGVWHDAEGVQVAILAAAGLCLLGVGGTLASHRPVAWHPAVLVLLALGAWSVLGVPFAEHPATALMGPPQSMYGIVWFVAQAAFLAAALIIARHPRLFALLVAGAVAMAMVVAWFNLRNVSWLSPSVRALLPRAAAHGFNEYLGYPALGLLALAATLPRAGVPWNKALAALAALVLLVLSGNRTAAGAALLGAGLLLCQRRWPVFGGYHLRLGRVVVLVTVPSVAIYLLLRFGWAASLLPSLASRQILLRVLEPELWTPPWFLLLGHGWGHYQSTLLAQLPLTGISLTRPDWIDFARDQFHSHHALAEALFAAGLPGAVLLAAVPVAVVAGARPAHRPVALALAFALVLLDSFWFQLPETMVPLALAVAATARHNGRAALRPHAAGALLRPSCLGPALTALVLGAGLLGLSFWQARMSRAMDELWACLHGSGTRCESMVPADPRQSQLALAMLLGQTLRDLQRQDWPATWVERFGAVTTEASRRCDHSCSPSLAMVLLNSQLMSAYVPKAAGIFSAGQWHAVAVRLAHRAPLRTDVLAPYLNWLFQTGGSLAVSEMLAAMPPEGLATPVGVWFSGLVQLDAPDEGERRKGIARMRQALSQGLERYMMVDPSIKSALDAAP